MSEVISEAQYNVLQELFLGGWAGIPFFPLEAFGGRDNASNAARRTLKALQGKNLLMEGNDGRLRMAVDACREAMAVYADKYWRRMD